MTLRVLHPGLYTLVVDLGRPRCRSLGMPVGGAADRSALILGNALVGNPPNAAALEITLSGPTLEAECDLACVVYGAPFELHSDRQELTVGKTFTLTRGEQFRIKSPRRGLRSYLCVQAGIQTLPLLESRSGLQPLIAGAVLPCLPGSIHRRYAPLPSSEGCPEGHSEPMPEQVLRLPRRTERLRVLTGTQVGWFQPQQFFTVDEWGPVNFFEITPASNRMGIRLTGTPLPTPPREMVSEPVCPGSVQVTRDGQCIILGVDGQTIGGYPKIAQVISADLDLLGQLRPGERICFVGVTQEEAETLWRDRQTELRAWQMRLQVSLGAFRPVALPRCSS